MLRALSQRSDGYPASPPRRRPSVKTADKRVPRLRGRPSKDGVSAAFALDALGLFLRSGPAAHIQARAGFARAGS